MLRLVCAGHQQVYSRRFHRRRRRRSATGKLMEAIAEFAASDTVVGLDGLEPTTSVLSGLRSNRLSYRPTVALHYTNVGA